MFVDVFDARKKHLIKYPIAELLCTGVLMFVFRLKSRRQITYKLRNNDISAEKFKLLWGTEKVPHGDTLNYFELIETFA